MRIAVTGANGFVGKALCSQLARLPKIKITQIVRRAQTSSAHFIDLNTLSDKDIIETLSGYDCLIHLAARAHSNHSTENDFQRDNIELSKRLTQIAISAKITHFVYLSSIKVLGNTTAPNKAFNSASIPRPADFYGQSKLESELAIAQLLGNSNTSLTIVRTPLVWGADCKGNLRTLITFINKGIPLPFAGIKNYRDVISLDNLCDFLIHIILNPKAFNATFLISDEKKRSTSDIIHLLESFSTQKARIIKIPNLVFKLLKLHPRLSTKISSFYDNLEVDISDTKSILNWTPKP